ncbi:exosortase A [Bowmanella denitrificans]|uniref:exosortase A n=1 Tax=Bowmanella denitrificans TaxID=366582 RepID=UPI000C9C97DE|nr:exosortase A [Bowmanella denitrificans]
MMRSLKPGHQLLALMLLVFGLWLALFFPTIKETVLIWERSETFAHCFLILPICIYLIRRNWPAMMEHQVKGNYWALLVIVAFLMLWLLGSLAQIAAVEQFAVFALLPLFYWLVLGNQICRVMLFALLFWMFSVPEGEFLIPWLQDITADITVATLRLVDIPVFRDGLYIAVPGGLFEVAVACSGIRYLIASFSLGTLFAYLTYQKWHKRGIFIAFSLVLPIFANGLRAFGIVLIAYLSDMKYATGVDHLIYGWVFFGLVIFIMFSIGNLWRDPEPDMPEQRPVQGAGKHSLYPLPALLVLSLAAILYHQSAQNLAPAQEPVYLTTLPGWQSENAQGWYPDFHNPSSIRVEHEGQMQAFYIFYNRNDKSVELINSLNQLYPRIWSRVSTSAQPGYQLLQITNSIGQRRWVAYTYITAWQQSPSTLEIKLGQALQAFLGQVQSGIALIVSAPVSAYPTQAEFAEAVQPWFEQGTRDKLHDL